MKREEVFNYAAGPSVLPTSVLEKAASELLNYGGTGMSVMEMSHRSREYQDIFDCTKQKFREALSVPESHEVLFLQGGGSLQFSMIPLNFTAEGDSVDYAVTGHFSRLAANEAERYCAVRHAFNGEAKSYDHIPTQDELDLDPGARYFYYCANNTTAGTSWKYVPDTMGVPIVCDMSSEILSHPVDVAKYGLIFAGAQKNMAPAGLTVVIVDKSLVGRELPEYIRDTFRIEMTGDNTIIGGLSMGGFGALHTALTYPDSFCACIALSSGLIIREYARKGAEFSGAVPPQMMLDIFGDPDKVLTSDTNPEKQYLDLEKAGVKIPRIYMACGTEDSLIGNNREFASFLKEHDADYIYEEGPGGHNWRFWNRYLEKGLDRIFAET